MMMIKISLLSALLSVSFSLKGNPPVELKVPVGHSFNDALISELFPPGWEGECSDYCCEERRKLRYYYGAQGQLQSQSGESKGRLLADMNKEYNDLRRTISFLEMINQTREDAIVGLNAFQKLPLTTNASAREVKKVMLPLKNMILIESIVEEAMDGPNKDFLHSLSQAGAFHVFAALERHFQCSLKKRTTLCSILKTQEEDDRMALQSAVIRFVNGHLSLSETGVAQMIEAPFEDYKEYLNDKFPEHLASASGKALLFEEIKQNGRKTDRDIPANFSALESQRCRNFMQQLYSQGVLKRIPQKRRSAFLRTAYQNACSPKGPPQIVEMLNDMKSSLERVDASIKRIKDSSAYRDLETFKRGMLAQMDESCSVTGETHITICPPQANSARPLPDHKLISKLMPNLEEDVEVEFLEDFDEDDALESVIALADPAEAKKVASYSQTVSDLSGPNATSVNNVPPQTENRELSLVTVTNDYKNHPFYEFKLELSPDGSLQSFHFDSHYRQTGTLIKRVKSFSADSFDEKVAIEEFKINVLEIIPHDFNKRDGGFFNVRYIHRIFPRRYKELKVGVVKRGEEWTFVDENGRHISLAHASINASFFFPRSGIRNIDLTYNDGESPEESPYSNSN